MQYIKYTILSLFFLTVLSSPLASQNMWRNTTLVGGLALGEQDRRLFDFPPAERLLERNPKKLDYDLILYLDKRVVKWHFLQVNAGIGYAENNTLFGRPFNHSKLNSGGQDLRYIKKYTINKLVLPVSTKFYIGNFYLQINAIPAIDFNKSVMDTDSRRLSKMQFTLSSIEVNPGLGFRFSNRLQMCINYRWQYFHEIDNIIFYGVLFTKPSPEFLQQKTETYNPFKMWLTVGYKLKR